jgi:hypothetical protein
VSQATVALTNLNPNTGYYFRIIAINDNGISEPGVRSDLFMTPSMGELTMMRMRMVMMMVMMMKMRIMMMMIDD